jgi:hypothetical protein
MKRLQLKRVLTFSASGHCYLMLDDLQQAYAAYQSALVNLRNPKVRAHLYFVVQ